MTRVDTLSSAGSGSVWVSVAPSDRRGIEFAMIARNRHFGLGVLGGQWQIEPAPRREQSRARRYLQRIRSSAMDLIRRRYLLAEDLDSIVERAKKHWTFATREEDRGLQSVDDGVLDRACLESVRLSVYSLVTATDASRGRSPKLQIMLVASPRNQFYRLPFLSAAASMRSQRAAIRVDAEDECQPCQLPHGSLDARRQRHR
jgi:hypothetical protein